MILIPKYKVNDWVIIMKDSESRAFLSIHGDPSWAKIIPRQINQVSIEENSEYQDYGVDKLIRYRVDGLWFDQNEIQKITLEKDPEYFL